MNRIEDIKRFVCLFIIVVKRSSLIRIGLFVILVIWFIFLFCVIIENFKKLLFVFLVWALCEYFYCLLDCFGFFLLFVFRRFMQTFRVSLWFFVIIVLWILFYTYGIVFLFGTELAKSPIKIDLISGEIWKWMMIYFDIHRFFCLWAAFQESCWISTTTSKSSYSYFFSR